MVKANIIDETRPIEDCIIDLPEAEAWGLHGEPDGGIAIVVNIFGMSVEVSIPLDEVINLLGSQTRLYPGEELPTITVEELIEGINVECKCDCCTTCKNDGPEPVWEDMF